MDDFEEKLNSILSSPEAMGQIMALANSISGNPGQDPGGEGEGSQEGGPPAAPSVKGADNNPLSLLQGLDPGMLERIMSLYREYSRGGDEKSELLQAMKPFLKEERREKLDKAVRIARFSRVIRAALEQFRGSQNV